MITKEELERIELREKEATPGLWFIGRWSGQCHMIHQHGGIGVCNYEYKKSDYSEGRCVSVDSDKHIELIGYDDYGPVLSAKDATFIANARQDVPRLIAEIRRLHLEHAIWEKHSLVKLVEQNQKYRTALEKISSCTCQTTLKHGTCVCTSCIAREALGGGG